MRDDDDLSGYDLDAWQVPPPSPGLADAIIARAKQPAAFGASEGPSTKPARRWWIGGALALGIAAVVAFAVWGTQRAPENGHGDVIAEKAQLVGLGSSSVQLDRGAELHWRRDKHRVTASQPRGTASWTIHGDDTFVIDAGAMVASVEASGASLRVEVTMNFSDARVMGASAVTAAVVAMVTVIVYEGHVKVASGGQTVVVEPGSSIELRNPALAPPVAVGASPDVLAEKDRQIANLRRQLDAALRGQNTAEPPACDQVACVLNNYAGECCERLRPTKKTPPRETARCDAAEIQKKGDAQLSSGMYAAALVTYETADQCKSDPVSIRKAAMAACRAKNVAKARAWLAKIPETQRGPLQQICVREGIDPDPCDAAKLRDQGQDALQTGADAAALAKFEEALACKPGDETLMRLAFLSACRAKNATSAQRHYPELPASTTTGIVQICVRNGITLPGPVQTGTLRLQSTPRAQVLVDGKAAGETPLTMTLAPGKHKVTFLIDDDKFTFSTKIEAGKTETMTKNFR